MLDKSTIYLYSVTINLNMDNNSNEQNDRNPQTSTEITNSAPLTGEENNVELWHRLANI